MNSSQAKEILVLYRPGSADADDPSFAEALSWCERDAELKRWFDEHCAVYAALRARFKETPIPEGLKEQILAERKIHRPAFWRRPALLAAAAVVVALLALAPFWLQRGSTGPYAFVDRMIRTALHPYGMVTNNDPVQVRAYLAQYQAPADYVLPAPLQKTAVTGCAIEVWQGANVSIVCFTSGKARTPQPATDLWLFVADRAVVPGAPATNAPAISRRNRVTTARWSEGNRTYLLVADGDESFIRKFL